MKKHTFSFFLYLALIIGIASTSKAFALPIACQSLTPSAIQAPITLMDKSLVRANVDVANNGPTAPVPGPYPGATKLNRDELIYAKNLMIKLKNWLQVNHLDLPYVSNASASYNVYLYASDTMKSLLTARHWASVSAVWNKGKSARDSIFWTTEAIKSLQQLGTQATVCYVDRVAPFNPNK
jgi:hypothetical protein